MEILKYVMMCLPSALLVAAGISIKYFKAYWMISGYNTMSKEKKGNVDIEKLGPVMGDFCFLLAGLVLVIILSLVFDLFAVTIAGILMFIACIIIFLIKAQKYDRNAVDENGRMKTGSKVILGVIIAFLTIVLTGAGFLVYQGTLPSGLSLSADSLTITGMYGDIVKAADMDEISMVEELPDITLRTNGSAVGGMLKGYFDVTGYGNAKLFLNTKVPPYIIIQTEAETYILNGKTKEETQTLYDNLLEMQGGAGSAK